MVRWLRGRRGTWRRQFYPKRFFGFVYPSGNGGKILDHGGMKGLLDKDKRSMIRGTMDGRGIKEEREMLLDLILVEIYKYNQIRKSEYSSCNYINEW